MTAPRPARVFVAGDWHGNGAWGTAMVRQAAGLGITTLLQLGDFGIWTRQGTDAYLDWLEREAARCDVAVHPIGGNHENYDRVDELEERRDDDGFVTLRPHVRWVPRGARWEWGGRRFGALGGAFSVDWRTRVAGTTWWPGQEELAEADIERLGDGPLDVLVTHDAPAGMEPAGVQLRLPAETEEATRRTRVLVLRAMRATHPRLVLHGHWHVRRRDVVTDHDDHTYRIEGLADDGAGAYAWGVLELGNLELAGGDEVGA